MTKIASIDSLKISGKMPPGTVVTFNTAGAWIWAGMGQIGEDSSTIVYASPNIKKGTMYGIMKYIKN